MGDDVSSQDLLALRCTHVQILLWFLAAAEAIFKNSSTLITGSGLSGKNGDGGSSGMTHDQTLAYAYAGIHATNITHNLASLSGGTMHASTCIRSIAAVTLFTVTCCVYTLNVQYCMYECVGVTDQHLRF